jgi:hypothetical protein
LAEWHPENLATLVSGVIREARMRQRLWQERKAAEDQYFPQQQQKQLTGLKSPVLWTKIELT